VAGTALAGRLALQHGLAAHLGGGTHHAHRAAGSGFTIFNDLVVAARMLQAEGLARHVMIIDLDVHQGDGTAAMAEGDGTIFTFSMHCESNFPLRKECSDWDIGLEDGVGDEEFIRRLDGALDQVHAPLPVRPSKTRSAFILTGRLCTSCWNGRQRGPLLPPA
jgi:acetoin utilization deacetylase AcuC-like enzyme